MITKKDNLSLIIFLIPLSLIFGIAVTEVLVLSCILVFLINYTEKLWGEKIDAKVLYDLFPGDPSKQGGRISGLPESRRKGGY